MTVKQIAEITGKNETTILRRIKKIFPAKNVLNGVLINLTEFETYRVLRFYQADFRLEVPMQSAEVPMQSAEVPSRQTADLLQATAKLIQQLRLAKKPAMIDLVLTKYLGINVSVSMQSSSLPLMLPGQISKEEEGARVFARNIINKRRRKKENLRKQNNLDFGGN